MEKKLCLIMKSGVEHWLSEKKAKEIADILVSQDKHQFLRIAELGGRVINTAEIEDGPCTEEDMADRIRIKNKEWKCIEGKWHEQKQKCFCAQEKARARADALKQKEMDDAMRPRTPEEQKRIDENFKKTRKILEAKGILAKKMTINEPKTK